MSAKKVSILLVRLIAPFVLLFIAVPTVSAKPAHKQAFADFFGPFLAQKLNNCQTCHLPDPPGAAADSSDKPHNAFGARLKALRQELRQAGKKSDIESRLERIIDEDTDGDGVANLIEILTGHAPGDTRDSPTAAELGEYSQKLAAYREYKNGYPWRPYEVVQRPDVPRVKQKTWVRNPVDAFIAQEHEARKLRPRPEASRQVLLRRLYLDLIGLPPTPAQLHAFLDDDSHDAYERVVERLLASPQYGERWGRHWMDVWRYSDWAGYGKQVRDSQPHIWHWRDWIIESLNQDKSYDRMILEMLAGDELAPDDPDTLRATGYLVRNFKLLSREKWLQDTVDHSAHAFLALTLGCARCHDHMYDPISQQEYYQVRAIFEPHKVRIDRLPEEPDVGKNGLPRTYDADLQVKTFLFVRGDDRMPAKDPLNPGVPHALGGQEFRPAPVPLSCFAQAPDKRPFVVEALVRESVAKVVQARAAREQTQRSLVLSWATALGGPALACRILVESAREAETLAALGVASAETRHTALLATLQVEALEDHGQEKSAAWQDAARRALLVQRQAALCEAHEKVATVRQALKARKNNAKKAALEKAVKQAEATLAQAEQELQKPASTAYTKRPLPPYPAASTGRRLAFARWIADRDNPRTARVAMNHIWLRHFGQALVPSVFDFGRNGKLPSHPALLDWLAAEFMDRGWSMKAMHRMLVTSNTYRMASTPDTANEAIDRDNRYIWRMPSRRVEAEVVRDCIFFVAHRLDITMGGPDIDYHEGLTRPRRSIYFRHAQEKQMEFLKLFDCAAVTECYQRKDSVLPQQALALANSELTIRNARLLARELTEQTPANPEQFTHIAFEQVLSRPPTAEEMLACLEFLSRQESHFRSVSIANSSPDQAGKTPSGHPALRARENLVHVLLNHHDFVTIR